MKRGNKMNTYYISLVQCLVGKCIKVEASSETVVREWACKNLGAMWCTVYDEPLNMEIIGYEYLGR